MNILKSALVVFSVFFITANLSAQSTSKIVGTVVDAETGETLIGVNVVIDGTLQGTATDIDGKYTIRRVKAGTYTIVASYLSFTTQTITGLVVGEGETKTLNITLKPESEFLEEIVVSAEAILNNEAGLLRQRQKSIAFSDAISSESISRSGAGDAAAAMKKVVGASVVDGKYIYVRGLGDRYSSTHLNGSELPSADPNKKSFQLDIFPSNLLENIITLKTFTPDRPGNFSGGLVDVSTKDFPDRMSFVVSASNSWNSQSSLKKVFLTQKSNTDWLGYDDGMRALPSEIEEYFANGGEQFPGGTAASRDPELATTLNDLSQVFGPSYTPSNRQSYLNQGYSVSLGNQTSLFGRNLGYLASLSYSQAYSQYQNGTSSRYAQIGSSSQTDELSSIFEYSDEKGTRSVDIGALVNLAYKVTSDHKIGLTYLRTQSGSESGRFLSGSNEDIPSTGTLENYVLEYVERSLTSLQFNGKHYFPSLLGSTLEWKAALASNTQDEPDRRQVALLVDQRTLGGNDTTLYSFPNGFALPSRFYRNLEEENSNIGADLSIPFRSLNSSRANFKIGINSINTDRIFRESIYDYILGSPNSISLNELEGDLDAYFEQMGIIGTDTRDRPVFGVVPRRISDVRNNFNGDKKVFAYYAMVELPIVDAFKIITGFRVEDAEINIVSLDSTVAEGNLNNRDVLPSVNAILSLNDKMNIRASFTKTLARPTFRELAPYASAEFTNGGIQRGNPQLERTLIENYDLRWEWFPNSGDVIAVSGFYKKFKNPIETVIEVEFGDGDYTYQNVPEATVLGIEFEVRKSLADLSHGLRHFDLSTNLTVVESIVEIPEEELLVIKATEPNASETRNLQGQSPFIVNLDLSYTNPELRFNSSLNYNVFGDRLSKVSAGASPDVFERSYSTLDFLMSKDLGKNFEVNFSAKNLLDPKVVRSQEFKGNEFINSSYKRGRSFSLGFKYKI